MSFSRLAPRSNRTKIAKTQVERAGTPGASRHLRLWEAIRLTREEIDQWQRQVNQVDTLFRQHIQPKEEQLNARFCDVTQALIQHFSQSQLDAANQSLLGLWISENLESMHSHPFADHSLLSALNSQWRSLINRGGAIENLLARLAKNHAFMVNDDTCVNEQASEPESIASNDEVQFDFGWHKKADTQDLPPDDDMTSESEANADSSDAKEGAEEQENETEPDLENIDEKVSSLEERLSVDRLFRQLARVLHPDREQDEQRKADKHNLMSQCLKARRDKDINTLLTLYFEHVGELPDELTSDSHEDLIHALEMQLSYLQKQLLQERFGNPLMKQIVERYHAGTADLRNKNIEQHAKALDVEIMHMQTLHSQLDHQDGLLNALDERRAIELDRLSIDEMTGKEQSGFTV